METCDVLIVGGGPAGAACAWKLGQAGLDVLVTDAASFPRDKVCAGWITPPVLVDLDIDVEEYRRGRTFQPITGFRTGLIGSTTITDTSYSRPVSFGIRRCEFDHYLLQRSRARLRLCTPTVQIRRDLDCWIVNDALRTRALVGAGGHFCPVARCLNGPTPGAPVIVAQEMEFAIDASEQDRVAVATDRPELYFCPDLKGYGWCFRKEDYLNIGFGRLDRRSLPKGTTDFVAFLQASGRIPPTASRPWRGHAYLIAAPPRRRVADAGVLLVGDAAGLAYPQSGEGIRPAIESGLLAAATLLAANGRYTRERLMVYEEQLRRRFTAPSLSGVLCRAIPASIAAELGRRLFASPWFIRHWLLDRWFLHRHEPALALQ